jgi:hypothetical protein
MTKLIVAFRNFANAAKISVLPTQCIYLFCMDLRIKPIISLYSIDWLITETDCVYCAVRTESMSVLSRKVMSDVSSRSFRHVNCYFRWTRVSGVSVDSDGGSFCSHFDRVKTVNLVAAVLRWGTDGDYGKQNGGNCFWKGRMGILVDTASLTVCRSVSEILIVV